VCGIAGILGREDRDLVRRMTDRIRHRGPDGEGIWTDDGVTLGHRRLSIVDLRGGAQPMESHDGRYCIVYNGEIYNHLAVRSTLEAAGATFATDHSDTETILEGYRRWGPDVVTKLEGMFAFALWDAQEGTLFIARDPFGIKPFFYACTGTDFVFASEQKALFAHPDIEPVVDIDRVKERATLEFLRDQGTLFHGIHQLPPGTWAVLRGADLPHCHVRWQPYYTVPVEGFASPEEAAVAIKDRFVASVKEQLMADVPVGVILSGGFDSAVVATAHQKLLSDAPIHTFTIAESDEIADFQEARRLAEHLGTQHHERFFDFDDMVRDLGTYAWHNENINYTEYFFMPLFEMMAKDVKVGLCGQGSDELWGGYARYRDPLPLARERIDRIRHAAPAHEDELATAVNLTHMSGQSLAEWDQQGQLSNFQLRLVDRNSMASSLEVRVPFLSKPLQQASRAVPWGWKVQGPTGAPYAEMEKWILRKALEDLGMPADLTWRKKVPAGRATAPKVMDQFEAHCGKLVDPKVMASHPLAGSFTRPAEFLSYKMWEEVFVGDRPNVQLEDLV
jgi:asparagine synthase (glutamine-hydrolysing)